MSAKCLRCGAGSEWIEGRAPVERRKRLLAPAIGSVSPIARLSRAYIDGTGLRLSAADVQRLVKTDNALQSLIEEWGK